MASRILARALPTVRLFKNDDVESQILLLHEFLNKVLIIHQGFVVQFNSTLNFAVPVSGELPLLKSQQVLLTKSSFCRT
jgi:hypothetical protein